MSEDRKAASEEEVVGTAGNPPANGVAEEDSDDQVWVIEDGAPTPVGEVAAETVETAETEEDRLRAELAEVREQWVRTLADLDNYRKRSEREAREVKRYALMEPMRDLVAVVDNLERALSAGGSVEDLKRGVEMILAQLRDLMRSYGVKEIAAHGAPFDPAVHDAVSRFEDPKVTAPTVAEEMQRGYAIFDRLLRPALVKVAMPAGDPGSE